MTSLRSLFSSLAVAAAFALPAVTSAATLSGTFSLQIWNATGLNNSSGSPQQQALPTNPIATNSNLVWTGVYEGAIDFGIFSRGNTGSTIRDFLNTGSGTVTGTGNLDLTLSASTFQTVTLFKFSDILDGIAGTITHDDGVSLFKGNTAIVTSASPTNVINTAYNAPFTEGFLDLYYVAANGNPSVLRVDVPIAPTALLLMSGLGLMGVARHRRS
jgi:hypothetical protein